MRGPVPRRLGDSHRLALGFAAVPAQEPVHPCGLAMARKLGCRSRQHRDLQRAGEDQLRRRPGGSGALAIGPAAPPCFIPAWQRRDRPPHRCRPARPTPRCIGAAALPTHAHGEVLVEADITSCRACPCWCRSSPRRKRRGERVVEAESARARALSARMSVTRDGARRPSAAARRRWCSRRLQLTAAATPAVGQRPVGVGQRGPGSTSALPSARRAVEVAASRSA